MFGAIAFIGDAVKKQYPTPEVRTAQASEDLTSTDVFLDALQIFLIFMLSVGFGYFIFLYVDIRLHVKKAKHAVKEKEKRIQMYQEHLAKTQVINTQSIV